MEVVFGGRFICRDGNIANTVCHDPGVKALCVSFDGDVYNPNGEASGGSNNRGRELKLQAYANYNTLRGELQHLGAQYEEAKNECNALTKKISRHENITGRLGDTDRSLERLEQRMANSEFA